MWGGAGENHISAVPAQGVVPGGTQTWHCAPHWVRRSNMWEDCPACVQWKRGGPGGDDRDRGAADGGGGATYRQCADC